MPDILCLESPAKVNLRLEILKKRKDGYHEIRTIFQKISLHDTLCFSLSQRRGIRITTDHPGLPTGKRNLVHRAAVSLLEKAGHAKGVRVDIKKRIPLGAGLGGGSSNAAITLKALNQLLKLNLNKRELMEIGRDIGADIPFFLFEGSAIGSGIGDRLRKITLPSFWYILIYPNFEVSSRWAYQNIVLPHSAPLSPAVGDGVKKWRSGSTLSPSVALGAVSFSKGKPQHSYREVKGLTKLKYDINLRKLLKSREAIAHLLHNDLETVVSARYPEIALMKELFAEAGARGTMMTGSGPTVFGLFPGEEKAKVAFQWLKKKVKGIGWEVIKAHSIR